MADYITKNIRNIVLLGHGSTGKTSLVEAMLYRKKLTDRLGKPTEGNTVCDYDAEEIKRGFTLSAAMVNFVHNDIKINVIDAPGYLGFRGEAKQAARVADAAIIVVDGRTGVQVGTDLGWDYATEAGIPKAFFINRFDDGEARFAKAFNALRERYGVAVCPIIIPMIEADQVAGFLNLIDMKVYTYDDAGNLSKGDKIPAEFIGTAHEYRDMLLESIAGTSDALMDKYFEDPESITREEAVEAIHEGIIHGGIVPVICGSAAKVWGIAPLLDIIADSFPRPTARGTEKDINGNDVAIDKDGDPAIFVFKTVADPFVGKMTYFKVMSGTVKRDMTLKNARGGEEKLAKIYTVVGKKQTEVEMLCCGDIGITAKLSNTNTNDTLSASGTVEYAHVVSPTPYMAKGIVPVSKGDEDKISQGIARLLEEDLSLRYENNAETRQRLVYGLGDIHLDVTVAKLKARYGVSVALEKQKIAYREAIRKKVSVEGKHKKQSGGHGQYGHVKIEFAPNEESGLVFTESTVGGSVPKNFHPAVQKGLEEAMRKGVLAGFPMTGLKANLFDGSYHDVDSSEMAFKMAASIAYKEGMKQASPVLMEPVMTMLVYVPDSMVGDILGDFNKRRGRVLNITPDESKHGSTIIEAEVPQAEVLEYTIALRSMTQGRGRYDMEFVRYEEVPQSVADVIIAENKANLEE
ncbi:MAG: elongation factor G [Ruminococcaceae bacterium]|nr:elongation factor G [Oscillospiraceae bacterium]